MSHSRGRLLGDCGEWFRLKYREQVPEQPGWALIGGKAWHQWAQDYELFKLGGVVPHSWAFYLGQAAAEETVSSGISADDFKVSGRKTKAHPDGETFEVWLNELGPQMIADYEDFDWGVWKIAHIRDFDKNRAEPGGLVPGIEYPMKLDQPRWQGYVDQIRQDRAGNLLVLDLKTGQRIYKTTQLEEYGAAGKLLGLRTVYGGYYLARKAEFTHTPLRWSAQQFTTYVEGRHQLAESGIFVPNVGDHCGWCPVRDHCSYA